MSAPQIDGPTVFITLLGILLCVFIGIVAYQQGRQNLIVDMKNYGCEKVMGYMIH